jgi:putative ABC transport system permease protein
LRTFLTATAIALGVAAVFAASAIGQSAEARTASLARQVSRADLQITPYDDDTLDVRWLDVVRAHPDVAQASPELVYSTILLEPSGASLILLGVEPTVYFTLEQVEMASGRVLILGKPWVVVPERWAKEYHVSVGGQLLVPVDKGAPFQLQVVGTLEHGDDAGAALRERMAFVPLSTLQDMLGLRQRLSRIRVTLWPGRDLRRAADSLSHALTEHSTLHGEEVVVSKIDTGSNTGILYGMMTGGLALTGAVILLAASLLIVNTFAMNVTERTREIGILRSLGMDRAHVLRGVLVEAVLLGLIGILVGLPLGWGLAEGIVRVLIVWQRLEWEQLSFSALSLIVAPVVGMGLALGSAWWPARRAARVSPMAAIHPHRETRPERDISWTWILGVILLLVALAVVGWLVLTPESHTLDFGPVMLIAILVALMTLVGGLLLLPPMVSVLAELMRGLLVHRLGVVGRLAGDQLARSGYRQRTMLTAGTLAVGVAMIILLSGTVGAMVNMSEDLVFGLMKEKLGIMAYSTDESFEASNPMSLQRQKEWPRGILALLDSLRDRAYVYGLGFSGPVREMEASPLGGLLVIDDLEAYLRVGSFRYEQGNVETAVRIIKRGRAILITPSVARRFGLNVGDEFTLTTKRGRVPFRVAAVGANPWWAPIVSHADAETYLGASIPIGYFITPRPGIEAESVQSRLQVGLRSFPQYKLFEFGPGSQAVQLSIGRIFGILTALLNGLTILALVIASLGQINTMMASVMQRVRELGVLRSVGLTRQQVQMLVLLEAAAVGVIGAIVGMLAGTAAALAYLVVFYTAGVEGAGFGAPTWASVSSGIATALSTTQWIALLALAFAPLMTMVAAWLPAHRAANLPVIQTIRDI